MNSRFGIDLDIQGASPGLDLSSVSFLLEVTPGLVEVPAADFAEPGDFIPDAFIVKSDPVHGAVTSASYSITSITVKGSTASEGLLASLFFDAVQSGTAQIQILNLLAKTTTGIPLPSPVVEYALVEVLDATATATPTLTPTSTLSPTPTPTASPSTTEVATETPSNTPTVTSTPTVTPTPTPLFSLWLEAPEEPIVTGALTRVAVRVSDVSSGLRLSEINFRFHVDGGVKEKLYLKPDACLAGSFVSNASLGWSDLVPSTSQATSARFRIYSGTSDGSSATSGKVMDVALWAQQTGGADLWISSASPVFDASGSLVRSPAISLEPLKVRVRAPVSGIPLEDACADSPASAWPSRRFPATVTLDEWLTPLDLQREGP